MENEIELSALDAFIYESSEQWAVAYEVIPKDDTLNSPQYSWGGQLCATEQNAEEFAQQIRGAILHLEWVDRVATKVVRLYPAPF